MGNSFLCYCMVCFRFANSYKICLCKNVCDNCEKIDAVIIDKSSSSFVRNGTHYKVVIKGTNTLFYSSTKYGITSQLKINEEVIMCIDQKNNEAIIISIK